MASLLNGIWQGNVFVHMFLPSAVIIKKPLLPSSTVFVYNPLFDHTKQNSLAFKCAINKCGQHMVMCLLIVTLLRTRMSQ